MLAAAVGVNLFIIYWLRRLLHFAPDNMRFGFFLSCWITGLLGVFTTPQARAQSPRADTLTVVNWNLEWFGDGSAHDPAGQAAGARAIMQGLGADVYALCEIVNEDSLLSLAASLPGGYSAVVSGFGSFADSRQDPDWPGAQKLAIVYRTSKVRVLQSRALLAGDPDAYYNFSSGRYPFLVRTEVKGSDGAWRAVAFIVLHAKAQADYQSCQRRTWGAMQLKDSLDRGFGQDRVVLLGDFNDDLAGTICGGGGPSNYVGLVSDSTDANHYRSLTLPLSKAGAYSLAGYSSLIDHVMVTNELAAAYVQGSAHWLMPEVMALVPGYESTVSDHYPILTRYCLNAATTGIGPEGSVDAVPVVSLFPNPAGAILQLETGEPLHSISVESLDGRLMVRREGGVKSLDVSGLPPGVYLLRAGLRDGAIHTLRFAIHR